MRILPLLNWPLQTSRRLHSIISGSLLLQYHICLAASGMRDGPLTDATTAERMAALREYTDAWRDLSWSAYDKIDIPGTVMPQFSDGVAVYLSEDRRELTVLQLPSKLRRLAAHRWTLKFDFMIARFVLDATQDLLALVPICVTPGPAQWYVHHTTFPGMIHSDAPGLLGVSPVSSSARSRPASRTRSPPQAQPQQAPSNWPRASCSRA